MPPTARKGLAAIEQPFVELLLDDPDLTSEADVGQYSLSAEFVDPLGLNPELFRSLFSRYDFHLID